MLKYATFIRRVSLLWSGLFADFNLDLYHTAGGFQKKHAAITDVFLPGIYLCS